MKFQSWDEYTKNMTKEEYFRANFGFIALLYIIFFILKK